MPNIEDVELELTTYCNADCALCYRNYKTFNEHYPKNISRPLDEVIEQLEGYENLKYVRLVGSISEPTLYKHFHELCKYIKGRHAIIELCTNGDTHTPEWWAELGEILSDEDEVYFTICGSTQELHEVYRTGTNLYNILLNAEALRKVRPIDFAQCIRFDYNDDDFNSEGFNILVNQFTYVYWTETFLHKESSNYKYPKKIELLKPYQGKIEQYKTVEKIANLKWEKKLSKSRDCKAFNEKRNQIDAYGNVYPCYLFLEASNGEKWDGDWDKILNAQYEVCKFCDKDIVKLCDEKGLDYII